MEKDQEFVEMVVKAIVDNPDKVKTERKVDEMGVLIELTVAPDDMGKIIGKEGKTAKSVRTLLRVLGAKERSRVNLKIVEPDGREPRAGSDEILSDKMLKEQREPKIGSDEILSDKTLKEPKEQEKKEQEEEEEIKPIEEKSTGVI